MTNAPHFPRQRIGSSDDRSDDHAAADRSTTVTIEPVATNDGRLAMRLLAAGIPLTLLLDLAENFGPPSVQILCEETADDSWVVPLVGVG